MIEFLQSLLRRVTGIGKITEEEIRNKHSIYIDAWHGSFTPFHPPQRNNMQTVFRRLRLWFKTLGYRVYHAEMRLEMRMGGARAPESKSHIPLDFCTLKTETPDSPRRAKSKKLRQSETRPIYPRFSD